MPADVEASIVSEHYFTAQEGEDGALVAALRAYAPEKVVSTAPLQQSPQQRSPLSLLTFCVLVLRNGFTVTGESACASPENFDADIGKRIARENAKQKIWPLLGFALRERLYQMTQPAQAPA